ncbi:helix-turn-helix transcriptional regulator [Hoeflea sp. TYP-13]
MESLADALKLDVDAMRRGVIKPTDESDFPEPNARIGENVEMLRKKMHVVQGSDSSRKSAQKDKSSVTDSSRTIGSETGRQGIEDDEIPEIDVVAGLGGGGVSVTTEVTADNGASFAAEVVRDHWRIPERLLWHANASTKHVAALPVQGDSMAPTIIDGDVVFIDTRHRAPSPPGLYALADEFGGMIVKRLEVVSKPSDEFVEVSIISDNKNHSTRTLTLQEISIVGRVIGRFTTS